MEVKLYNQSGEEVGNVELPDAIFNVPINQDLIHQAVVIQGANARKILAHAKGRSEVRGGGRKPWRQKGTGRARHGSIRSPIWRGGGVTHGPLKQKVYFRNINKKARRKALFMALSSKIKDSQLIVLDSISLIEAKTKKMKEIMDKISVILPEYPSSRAKLFTGHGKKSRKKTSSILLVQPDSDKSLIRASRNLNFTKVVRADGLNTIDVLEKKYLVLLKNAIPVIEKTYLK